MITLLQGDWMERLPELAAESVHCIVTSPPYWGLRDYGLKGQLGLEKTPAEYITKMVAGFRELRRVLRSDGTVWLNLGDTYRKKQLQGIPWRVALALQADGWLLRQENIWEKPNPLPESITDRCSNAHESIFMLASRSHYYFDHEAIKEPCSPNTHARLSQNVAAQIGSFRANGGAKANGTMRAVVAGSTRKIAARAFADKRNASYDSSVSLLVANRNKRSVWRVTTQPYKGAHFATFPPKLVEPCILAGTSAKGCCAVCGAPWKRVIVKGPPIEEWKQACGADRNGEYHGQNTKNYQQHKAQPASTVKARILAGMVERHTVDWKPTCKCVTIADPVPCVVLDPFGGSGTVAQVAKQHGRDAIYIDLNPEYLPLARKRISAPQR